MGRATIVAQGSHAAVAAIWKYRNDDRVRAYTDNLDSMHKVVLGTKNEASLLKLADALAQKGIPFYLWTEQPENTPTCLATVPVLRSDLGDALKRCSLLS
ncbi:peptidyl-tRNA hydrolase domain-containing protein 1 [Coemansia helicoidea]|uniref:Peptidyl-tRNA hydrolase domain-containing protein 1 n=1 Tax=Coemansia helicoidea TaxID=1286919 RepID=A0ACC1KZ92_9FUNG|nr:peptidyl-tRNA hydrolase domain-containing protein 1 [Coemansia helicoidea]